MSDNALVKLDAARRMLAEVRSVPDAVHVADLATAATAYARRAKLGLEAQNDAAEIKVRAERLAGEMLRELERGQAGRPAENMSNGGRISPYAQALDDAGVSRQDASRWQKLATFDVHRFEEMVGNIRHRREEITTAFFLRAWRREEKSDQPPAEIGLQAVRTLEEIADTGRKFGTVYADPPWLYGNQGTRGATGDHYSGMTVEELAGLPISSMVADNAHLHLWTTNAFLFDCKHIMEAWGFDYKSCFVWVKPQMGMGNYWRVSHEFCLFGVRGSAPFRSRAEMSWQQWPRGKHSAKPERMYELIERVSPGPYLEMFARRTRRGWSSWGNEIEQDLWFQEVPA